MHKISTKAIKFYNMKITIITPSYNQGKYIEQTILSILNQNYPDLEYMIFDGGSTDNSLEIIKKYENKLAYWESEKDRGQSHAINKGFAKATGEIITWINSDDQLTPNTLENVATYFSANPNIAFLHGKTILFQEGKGEEKIKGADSNDLNYKYLAGLPFPQPSSFFKKILIDELGGLNEKYHYGMDYDLFLSIFLNGEGLKVEDIFSKYLLHQSSKSVSQSAVFAKDYAAIFSKLLRSFSFSSDLIAQMKDLGIYQEGNDVYKTGKVFTIKDLEIAFCYNLYYQITFYYEAGELSSVYPLTSFLKKQYPNFYKQNQELAAVHLRAKFLNKQIIGIMRNFLR